MSEAYVSTKVQEALEATGGDKRDAQKLLITWAVRDQQLLLGLAKPHLKAIAAARLEHVSRPEKTSASAEHVELSRKEVDDIIMGQGKGEKRGHIKVPPPKSSERQASVMHQLAAAFKKKKN